MAIVIRSGFLAAVQAVRAFLTAKEVDAEVVVVGFKQRMQQLNQSKTNRGNRVVFQPSDDDGKAGRIVIARQVGDRDIRPAIDAPRVATIRSLAEWERLSMVSVWATDLDAPNDEEAQGQATETLYEWVVRAVHSAPGAFANALWGDVELTPTKERSFGLELRAALTFRHPIFDEPREVVYPTGAQVDRNPDLNGDG